MLIGRNHYKHEQFCHQAQVHAGCPSPRSTSSKMSITWGSWRQLPSLWLSEGKTTGAKLHPHRLRFPLHTVFTFGPVTWTTQVGAHKMQNPSCSRASDNDTDLSSLLHAIGIQQTTACPLTRAIQILPHPTVHKNTMHAFHSHPTCMLVAKKATRGAPFHKSHKMQYPNQQLAGSPLHLCMLKAAAYTALTCPL